MTETRDGYAKDCFVKIEVTDGRISMSDAIHIKGHTTDRTQ